MSNTLVICGDSFNYGIGCSNLATQPYGVLTAEALGMNCIRLARGSASNYAIYLQGMYSAQMNPKPKLVILGVTSYDRVEWIAEGKRLNDEPKLQNLNYHLYPPHYMAQPLHDAPMPWHLSNDNSYDPKILTEHVVVFSDYFKQLKEDSDYYRRFRTEPHDKLKLIDRYYFEIWDSWIKRDYDTGLIMLAYRKIKKSGINCIIAGQDNRYQDFVDNEKDFYLINWGQFCYEFPDDYTSHCDERAHKLIADGLIKHIKINGFI